MAHVILITKPLPKWLTIRYALLWRQFNDTSFTYEQAQRTLHEKGTLVIVVLSTLKKMGWIAVSKNPKDKRTRLYTLVDPTKAMVHIAKSQFS